MQIAEGGRLLLAADAGSNQVSALRIHAGRVAAPAERAWCPQAASLPVSIAVHGSLVYVANAGPADSNYTGFRLASWGSLTPSTGSDGSTACRRPAR